MVGKQEKICKPQDTGAEHGQKCGLETFTDSPHGAREDLCNDIEAIEWRDLEQDDLSNLPNLSVIVEHRDQRGAQQDGY